jgi:hypothetical protein
MKDQVERIKGKTVPLKNVKYQTRVYFKLTMSIDILPVRWKYFVRGTQAVSDKDRPSYAVKWLFVELHIESVRMNRRQ